MQTMRSLTQLLESAAFANPQSGIIFHSTKQSVETKLTYKELLGNCKAKAKLITNLHGTSQSKVALIHFDNHRQNIEWFWAAVFAGYLPAISTPLTNNAAQRQKHLVRLKHLLHDPVVLTREGLGDELTGVAQLNVQFVEKLFSAGDTSSKPHEAPATATLVEHDVAVLMLTSGSTGNAKAVALENGQIFKALEGKALCHATATGDVFLNWIGLDHVASLIEVHLLAMLHGADQIHMQPHEVIGNPLSFLTAIDRYRVSFSFAPNFFLARLQRTLVDEKTSDTQLDLSCLRTITSGGEANTISTSVEILDSFSKYGASREIIVPGFGMTETCAGSIHNNRFPEYDISQGLEFASLGQCHKGISMRIRLADGSMASPGEVGALELAGPLVFKEYYNDPLATDSAFASDGWFITGDLALIDAQGMLRLAGRAKESLNINGIKYNVDDIEAAIDEANIAGVAPSFTKVFPIRPKDSPTEGVMVVYVPTYLPDDHKSRSYAASAIDRTVQIQCGSRPLKVIPLPSFILERSSLGKLSRAKIRESYEQGQYAQFEKQNEEALATYRAQSFKRPARKIEETICEIVAEVMDLSPASVSVTSSLMEMGVSSVEVIKFKQKLQAKTGIPDIPIITILTNPVIEDLAAALDELSNPVTYNPVVVLNNNGAKTPLWLVHPGAGEILVYLNMAKYINDRPLYALRARGFDGEDFFKSIPEVISTYLSHIKRVQPNGPYAILGYSFGSMFAVELTKALVCGGDEVKFTAVLNLPPHIKQRIRQLNMVTAILTLALFLGLVEDDDPETFHSEINNMTYNDVLDEVLRRAPPGRLDEVGMTRDKFLRWAQVSNALHEIAWDYEPSAKVAGVDVFVAHPLKAVAKNKEEWFNEQLTKWNDFSETPPRFHQADGQHFDMIDGKNIVTFQKKLKAAMQARGI